MSEYVPLETLLALRDAVIAACAQAHKEAAYVPDATIAPFDGGPRLRPHTIEGWWQVWSGSICIALLKDEDVEPVRAAPRRPAAPLSKRRTK